MKRVHYVVAGLLVALRTLPLHAGEVEPPKVHNLGRRYLILEYKFAAG